MGSSKTVYNPPTPIDYGESMRDALTAQVEMAPALFSAEADQYYGRPAYARMEQEIARNAMVGQRRQVDENGYVIVDDKSFNKEEFTQFKTEKEAILAKAKEIDPSGGVPSASSPCSTLL